MYIQNRDVNLLNVLINIIINKEYIIVHFVIHSKTLYYYFLINKITKNLMHILKTYIILR